MCIVSTVWGARLTANFARRGGYVWPPWDGEEDYRWVHVQKMIGAQDYPMRWHLFNLGFICIFQHFLLLGTALPAYIVFKDGGNTPLDSTDWILACLVLLLVVGEGIADEQQWNFQNEKYRQINNKITRRGMYKDGFIQSGLWALSRHPNYFCEQSIVST